MKSIKNFLIAAVCGLALISFSSSGQTAGGITLSSVPSTITTLANSNVNQFVDFQYNRQCYVQLNVAGITNGSVVASFRRSQDGTTNTMDTADFFVLTASSNAGLRSAVSTNIDIGAAPYIICAALTNSSVASATNVSVKFFQKPPPN